MQSSFSRQAGIRKLAALKERDDESVSLLQDARGLRAATQKCESHQFDSQSKPLRHVDRADERLRQTQSSAGLCGDATIEGAPFSKVERGYLTDHT